jgi:uncharacterized protein (TIGR02246 family)
VDSVRQNGALVKADAQIEAAALEMLERFCSGFAARDAEELIGLFAPDADVVAVSSEEALLRGPEELRGFFQGYARGPTAYSWTWERHDVSAAGDVAWLLAEGTETAVREGREEHHPYRLTIVCERRNGRWLLLQVHGSSPQHA